MDGIRDFLELVRSQGLAVGHFRGLLHIAIGRKVTTSAGAIVSSGLTWRELAAHLKLLRFDKDLVRDLGADPEALAPRDRTRFWYSAIALAHVDSAEALADAEKLAVKLKEHGYIVGPAPAMSPSPAAPTMLSDVPTAGSESKATPRSEPASEKPAKRKNR